MSFTIDATKGEISGPEVKISGTDKVVITTSSYSVNTTGLISLNANTANITLNTQGNLNVGFDSNVVTLYGQTLTLNPSSTLTLGVTSYPRNSGTQNQILVHNGSGNLVWSDGFDLFKPKEVNQTVSTSIPVSGNLAGRVFYLTTGADLTILDDNWHPGDRFEVIAKVSGVSVSAGSNITINSLNGTGTVTFTEPFTGATFLAETSSIFTAIGRFE